MITDIRGYQREINQARRNLDSTGVGAADLVALLYNFMGDPACEERGHDMLVCAQKIGEAFDIISGQLAEASTIARKAAQLYAEHEAKVRVQMSRLRA
jgi:hypothetical protein